LRIERNSLTEEEEEAYLEEERSAVRRTAVRRTAVRRRGGDEDGSNLRLRFCVCSAFLCFASMCLVWRSP
jgi:hypothetical protein